MPTFRRGVHPRENKSATRDRAIEIMPAPDEVLIPLSQHVGAMTTPVVQAGDRVLRGQLIATSDKYLSADVFSSVTGEVVGFEGKQNATGMLVPHVRIRNDRGVEEASFSELADPSPEEIVERVRAAGITGMGGASFPLHVKLSPPKDKKIDTLVINGAECEPYLTCDYRIMLERAEEVADGILLLARALGAEKVLVGVEDNKPDAAETLRAQGKFSVVLLKTKYPQGAEKQLIYALTKRKVPDGGLPMDVGCVVSNIQTALATSEACRKGKPLYERVLTVSGGAVAHPKNLLVPTGTSCREVVDFCGGVLEEPVKIISGGPMMGFAMSDLEPSVTKGTSGILLLTGRELNLAPVRPCINCGRCRDACPMNLMPMYIDNYSIAGDLETAKRYGAMSCIECGSCAYSCPSKRPLVQSIRLAKKKIREKKL